MKYSLKTLIHSIVRLVCVRNRKLIDMRLFTSLFIILSFFHTKAQTTQLQNTSCLLGEIKFNTYLNAEPVNGGIQYRFKVENVSYGTVDSIVKLGYSFNLDDFNSSQTQSVICRYNSELIISVAVDLGQGFGNYGPSCAIRTGFPIIKQETLGRTVIASAGGTLISDNGLNDYILTNTLGETKTKTEKVFVFPPNTFILNEGFQQPDQWIVESTENQKLNTALNIKVYPNPFSGNIIIDSESPKEDQIDLNIYAADGRFIKTYSVQNSIQELNLNYLSSGKYIFEFSNQKTNIKLNKTLIKSY